MRAPDFWRRPGLLSTLLTPMALAYGAAGRLRFAAGRPWRAPVPVLCVGNLVAGG
ncbi:MAG: tetraacyldisaccharide 4'-kinase, partial [Rhodospirillales bacterium]